MHSFDKRVGFLIAGHKVSILTAGTEHTHTLGGEGGGGREARTGLSPRPFSHACATSEGWSWNETKAAATYLTLATHFNAHRDTSFEILHYTTQHASFNYNYLFDVQRPWAS